MIRYETPGNWIRYDGPALTNALAEAKSVVLSLKTVPYQRRWVERLQQMELKREVAGTSRIEGAEFTERELDAAMRETPEQLVTRSQRQAHAAVKTYRWISKLPHDRPVTVELICAIHRQIVSGADDDHCPPGQLRERDQNVNFGSPRHRGAEGGQECERAFADFAKAIQHEYRDHDPIVQALAAHYHLAAMHPFLDGNGRTARALEALMLQRAGLRDTAFIAMSNYYYDEKSAYLATLAEVRQKDHDLTSFLQFALKGVALQSQRLLTEIQHEISKELFRNLMVDLFTRLKTPRKRVIAERQLEILRILLEVEWMDWQQLIRQTSGIYASLKTPLKAIVRDVNNLSSLNAIRVEKLEEGGYRLRVRLEWPTEITETDFFRKARELPKAKTLSFLH
ncbi:MAG: Fic family protein [candidate division NC10 bacterium]